MFQDKKILIVSTNADLSGAPLHVRDLVLGIKDSFNRVVVVFGADGVVNDALKKAGVETYIVQSIKSDFNVLNDLISMFHIARIVRRVKPNIIHAHSTKAGMVARIVGWLMRVPVLYTVHGWGFGLGRRRFVSLFVRGIELILRNFTSHYIAVSGADASIGVDQLSIARERITTIYNGVHDTSFFSSPGGANVLVMVARDDHQKDYDTFFRSAACLVGESFEVWCVGRDTDNDEFKARARDLAPDVNFVFWGVRSDVDSLLSRAGVFVLTSRFEGLPISIIEAFRAGLPVVATSVGGVPEMISNGVNGYLVGVGDIGQVSNSLRELLNNPTLRRKMGEAARKEYLMRFDGKVMLNKTLEVYGQVCR